MPETTPEIPEDEAATKLGDAYDLDVKAAALREFADQIDAGPGIPLRPSIYSALAREKAEDAEQQAGELRDSVPSLEAGRCAVVEVDGEPIRVQGGADMDATDRAALGQLVGAAKRQMADDVARCRVCGCTEEAACPGGCTWWPNPLMLGELCSSCAARGVTLLEAVRRAEPEAADGIFKITRAAIADPGRFLPRGYEDRDGERLYDTVPHWGAQAVAAAVLPAVRAEERAKVAEEIATVHWTGRDPERDRFVDEITRTVRGERP